MDTIVARKMHRTLDPWEVPGQEDCRELRALFRPFSRRLVEIGRFGF